MKRIITTYAIAFGLLNAAVACKCNSQPKATLTPKEWRNSINTNKQN